MKGKEVIQCAFVESTLTSAPFFASPCKFGPGGVEEVRFNRTARHASSLLFPADGVPGVCPASRVATRQVSHPRGPSSYLKVLGFGELSAYEKQWFDKMIPDLQKQITKGIDFVNKA